MTRARTQTTGYNRPLSPTNPPKTPRAQQLLARSRGGVAEAHLPKKPPHRHQFDGGNKCKVCGLEVNGLADGLKAIGYTEGEVAEATALVDEEAKR